MASYCARRTTQFQIKMLGNQISNNNTNHDYGDLLATHELVENQMYGDNDNIVETEDAFFTNLFVGVLNGFIYVYAPLAVVNFKTDPFYLPAHQLPQNRGLVRSYIHHLMYSLDISAAASDCIANHVASFLLLQSHRNNIMINFHALVAVHNDIRPTPMLSSITTILDKFKINNDDDNELQNLKGCDCSICLGEITSDTHIVKIPCGHAFHQPCILAWLFKSNSCPLCRTPLQLHHQPVAQH